MRNLKKLIAVIMVVAMIASLMVPALAAQNEDLAKMLQELGLFKGYSDTELGLDDGLTREQALAFMLRVMGLEDEVQAMDAEEVAEYMGRVVDPETVTATWAHPYVAYAIKHDLTRGVNNKIYPNVEFDGQRVISGKEFIRFILNGLGFTPEVVGWDDVLDKAQEIGLLTAGEVVRYGSIQEMTRDEAVYVLVSALDATTVDGITLAQALYNAGAVDKETLAKYGYAVEDPTPEEEPLTMTVTAKKANVLEVAFNNEVDTANVTLTVKKGASKVSVDKTEWSADKKVATITTTAKMTAGTYTVEAKVDEETTLTGTVEIKNQYVAEIKLLNEVALTNSDSKNAYVYYDVLDQYGDSIRASTSIEWSFSAEKVRENRNLGVITLKKSDDNAFVYGEKIYVTGVYTRTGTSVTGVLTVGPKQAVNDVEIAGFVKKGTNEILETLPAGFKEGEYYMVYTVTDQNGNPIVAYDVDEPVTDGEITFISDNVLVIKEFNKNDETVLTIDGIDYNAILVVPGINVSLGGEVTIIAIANKTGNRVEKNVAVGEDQILTSFTLLSPADVIADGEEVEIPFVATDQNGNEIKNFVTLAKQSDFNRLTFTSSSGILKLSENDDGTAKLVYTDDSNLDWTDSETTDGIDRTVSLTAVVVGGSTSNLLLHIQDKARPDAIKAVDVDTVLVERGNDTIALSDITFIDQYGREMSDDDAAAFFKAAAKGQLRGNDFSGYNFVVRATFKGENGYFGFAGVPAVGVDNNVVAFDIGYDKNGDAFTTIGITAKDNKVTSSKTGFSLKFEIVKYKVRSNNEVEASAVSPAKNVSLTIVDIKAVSGYTVNDLNKFFVKTAKSGDSTGDTGSIVLTNDPNSQNYTYINDVIDFNNDYDAPIAKAYNRQIKVTGKFGGKDVTIPYEYLKVESSKLSTDGAEGDNNAVIDAVYVNGFKWSDFYDAKTARYVRKDAEDTIKVAILDLDNNEERIDVISKEVAISDENPRMATIEGPDAITASPNETEIKIEFVDGKILGKEFKFKDQYGVEIDFSDPNFASSAPTFKVSQIVENEDGYVLNNFKVFSNDTGRVRIEGAERGDTFVLTIKAGNVTKTVNITVGADVQANITGSDNNYLEVLVKQNLKTQREQLLN